MGKVSRWEILGVPAALVFSAVHELGALGALGLAEHHIPHLMVLAYVVTAGLKAAIDKRKPTDVVAPKS